VDNSNLITFNNTNTTKPILNAASDLNGDSFYIHYLLSAPISTPVEPALSVERESGGSVTSRQAPKDNSTTHPNNRPNTAKVGLSSSAGNFPLVSRQVGLRQYVKPLRELHVLPSIIALEEKIGQRHISNILECPWKQDEEMESSGHGDILNDIPIKFSQKPLNTIKVQPSHCPQNEENSRKSAKNEKLPSPNHPHSEPNLPSVAVLIPSRNRLKTYRDRHSMGEVRSTQRRKTAGQSRQEITTNVFSSSKKSSTIPLNRNASANGFAKVSSVGSSIDSTLPPPSVEAFFKPVVHPDGVFSTPVLEIANMTRASTSVNDFLSGLISSSRNNFGRK